MVKNEIPTGIITVEVEQGKYDELITDHAILMMLLNTIFNNTKLTEYSDTGLTIRGDDKVLNFLNGVYPTRVDAVKRYLKEEEAKKYADEEASTAEEINE